MNRFSFELLQTLVEEQPEKDICLSPVVVYLPLALLRSVAMGSTRSGLTQALRMNELITEEERQKYVQNLICVLEKDAVGFGATATLKKHWIVSPSFLDRARKNFNVVFCEGNNDNVVFKTHFLANEKFSPLGKQVRHDGTLGIYVASDSGMRALTLLIPAPGFFWQRKLTGLQALVEGLNEEQWHLWQALFYETPESEVRVPPLPALSSTVDLLPFLTRMNFGPGITPAADFSPMMAAGDAPYLAGLRHGFNLAIAADCLSKRAEPLVWFLTDVVSGLVLALGVHRGGVS